MLQHLRVKKVERLGTYPNSNKRRDSYLMMHPMKVNYPQGADIPFKFCSSDLELFGGYQGAVKFTLKRGVYQNDYLNVGTPCSTQIRMRSRSAGSSSQLITSRISGRQFSSRISL